MRATSAPAFLSQTRVSWAKGRGGHGVEFKAAQELFSCMKNDVHLQQNFIIRNQQPLFEILKMSNMRKTCCLIGIRSP